jgi:hypothetical protein
MTPGLLLYMRLSTQWATGTLRLAGRPGRTMAPGLGGTLEWHGLRQPGRWDLPTARRPDQRPSGTRGTAANSAGRRQPAECRASARHAIIGEKRPQKGGEAANCALGARYLCPKWPDLH